MHNIDLYRTAVTVLALVGLVMNLSLAVAVARHHDKRIATPLWLAYSAAAAGTLAVSAYFRTRDQFADLPVNVGDFTALVPVLGFITASVVGWRILGRIVGRADLSL